MPRGGKRTGTPGASYTNRSDLQTGSRPLPVTTAPSAQYGAATAQAAAQKQVPMASGPLPTAGAPPAPGGPPAPVGPLPGEVTPLDAPSENPGEHVMTGVAAGPGAGPEILLPQGGISPLAQGVGLLASLGDDVPDQVRALRSALLAANANSSAP